MKKYLIILIVVIVSLMIYSCNDTTTNPETSTKGSIYLTSVPAGAQIWLNGTNQNKVTPDSLTNLDAGSFQITLKLAGYKDTTFSVDVTANNTTNKNVVLTLSLVTTTFGPVQIWETAGTGADQPSGLDLSSGNAYGVSSSNNVYDDIYYSSSGYIITSADNYPGLTRTTYFLKGNGTNINDGVASPQFNNATWTDRMGDRETSYYFLYDADGHYSKVIIDSYGTTPFSWVKLKWIYNQTAGDTRF